MKKKLVIALITTVLTCISVRAEFGDDDMADFTGEAFFGPATLSQDEGSAPSKSSSRGDTLPPVKMLRLNIQEKMKYRDAVNNEFAPTAEDVYNAEAETSEYASKELKEEFNEEIVTPDGFEADEEAIAETEKKEKKLFKRKNKEKKKKNTEDIILDCQNVDYDAPNHLVYATGDVSVNFVKQGIKVLADIITFDRANNTIKAEGNVRILKGSQKITGDYIFVDLNEENALIENPLMTTATMEIKSKKGYVYGDRIVQTDGSMHVDKSFPVQFMTLRKFKRYRSMMIPKDPTLSDDMQNGLITLKAKDIKVTQNGNLEIISLKRAKLFKGDKVIFKTPSVKLYTNKNLEFADTNHWEIGSYRGLGMYAGPGFALGFPHGAVLKVIPIINYKSGLGYGGYGRFSSATNKTIGGYGTAADNVVIYGKQQLDDNLFMQYSVNGYMNEWFLGRRRPKYGASLVYSKKYASNNFLYKGHASSFTHRLEGGYFNDLDHDRNFEKLSGNDFGTSRFRYMAEVRQNIFKYRDKEKLKALSFDLVGQVSTSVYGSGETQAVARFAPNMRMQYKRWMQDVGFFMSTYEDNTPMPVFDAYRYGKRALYLREYFRINKYLTVAWFGNINLSNDSPNGKDFQENSFYLAIGPDDFKFNIGYDFVRENLYAGIIIDMDAKGTKVEYETFEIEQHKKTKDSSKEKAPEPKSDFRMSGTPVLQKAVVENIKEVEDVI